jgi:hypothetical protein
MSPPNVPLTATYPGMDETTTSGREATGGHPHSAPKFDCATEAVATNDKAIAMTLFKLFNFFIFFLVK